MPLNLAQMADKLEIQLAIKRLLAHVFSPAIELDQQVGRYYIWGQYLQQHPLLLQALLIDNDQKIRHAWTQTLQAHQSDVRFLHTLAIIHWEMALNGLAHQEAAERDWIIATALFLLLLAAPEFWDYFAANRWTTEQGERSHLSSQQIREQAATILDDILGIHSMYGKQYFSSGRYSLAHSHVRCLATARNGSEQLLSSLQTYNIPCDILLDDSRMTLIQNQANKVLDEWCALLVKDAEQRAGDADAIRALPEGIRKNYQSGLQVLNAFVNLNVPILRVLTTALTWYNEWSYDLYNRKETPQLEEVVQAAHKIVDQLIPLSAKEQRFAPENKAISKYYLYRGYIIEDPEKSQKEYKEALAWDATNINAKDLLDQACDMTYFKKAVSHRDKKEFNKAYTVLDEAEPLIKNKKVARELRGTICFQQGFFLAQEGMFREALVLAKKARELDPDEDELYELFIKKMEEAAPEEDNIRCTKRAEEALKEDKFDQAIQYLSRIPNSSEHFEYACNLQAIAYFQRGVVTANEGNLARGTEDLRRALQLGTDVDVHKKITEQLSVILNARANELAKTLNAKQGLSRNEILQRIATMRLLLEEAIRLNPSNSSARANFNAISSINK